MKRQSHHLVKLSLLVILSLALIAACYQPIIKKSHPSLLSPSECRVVQHKLGDTCVPVKPRRIIALDSRIILDPLIALGVKPIGFASHNSKGKEVLLGVSSNEVKEIKNVGDSAQPSLEEILMLKPDLILSTDYSNTHQRYRLLSAIAPTVSIPTEADIASNTNLENKAFFKENLRYIARLIGQEAKAEEELDQYQRRVEELRKRLEKQAQKAEISVIFYGEGYIWTIARSDSISHILTDAGLRYRVLPDGKEWMLSIEAIDEYDADVVFIVDIDERSPNFYSQNSIFSRLKAFKNNRAYVVSQENWRSFGISGANKILDDLYKYLVNTS
ncbi:iron-siderophore ABC transporter substrate-binding protein [Leptolyngbya sp. AN03gr2]